MASVVKKIEFLNNKVSPAEVMGSINYPEDKFIAAMDNPPVGDDYKAYIIARAIFNGDVYSAYSPEVKCALNVTKQPLLDSPLAEIVTADSYDLDNTFDCSFVNPSTEFAIDKSAITSIEINWKKEGDAEWTVVELTGDDITLTDNVFTSTYALDITDSDIYMVRVRAFDSTQKLESGSFVPDYQSTDWSPIKYINKGVLYTNTEGGSTDDWYWWDSGTASNVDRVAW